jgi:hypothetical protein
MSILTSTVNKWDFFEASLLEWRRLCKRMKYLDSSRGIDFDRDRTHLGEVLWGIELKSAAGPTRMIGLCWEWREVIPNVLALSNPLGIQSNLLLKDERGEIVAPSTLVLHLNAAVNSFAWQSDLIVHAGVHRYIAA